MRLLPYSFLLFFLSVSQEIIGSAVYSSGENPVFISLTFLVPFLYTIVFLSFTVLGFSARFLSRSVLILILRLQLY